MASRHDRPAVVLGEHITGLAVLRALGRSGVAVYCGGRERTSISRSRWYRPLPGGTLPETSDGEDLATYLRTVPFPESVLFPCSDRWAVAVASLPTDVAEVHVATVAPLAVLRVLIDKELFARAAESYDVPAPRLIDANGIDSLTEDELQSFFLKPRDSQPFAERFGAKALPLEDTQRARQLLERLSEEGVGFILQEYIPGPATAHVFLDGYVDRSGVMRACLARRRLRMHPNEYGNSTLSITIPVSEVAEAVANLRRLFDGLAYVGLFDAEFKFDARDGRFKILEVNARPWWQLELSTAAGVDVCTMAYRDALGEPVADVSDYQIGKIWVHPIPDLRAWWTGRRSGQRSGPSPLRAWFGGANAVFSWDDPLPSVAELTHLGGRLIHRAGAGSRRGPVAQVLKS